MSNIEKALSKAVEALKIMLTNQPDESKKPLYQRGFKYLWSPCYTTIRCIGRNQKSFIPSIFLPPMKTVDKKEHLSNCLLALGFVQGMLHNYAFRSVKFLVANTLLDYKFSTNKKPKDCWDMDHKWIFTIYPASGFKVKIDPRHLSRNVA